MSASAQSLVIAEKSAMAEARDLFSSIGANIDTTTLDKVRNSPPKSHPFICFYVGHALPDKEFSEALRNVKRFRNSRVLFYVPHHDSNLIFDVGFKVGRVFGKSAEIASSLREIKLRLRTWQVAVSGPPSAGKPVDLIGARRRLGLTQHQMASALHVTTRTLQNWEGGVGTSQMERKTKDMLELLQLMDDYVVEKEEKNWLDSPQAAFGSRKPIDLLVEGKVRDLIVEFQRLREGQPI